MPNFKKELMAAAGLSTRATTGAVQFDGSTYIQRGADLTGNSDSSVITFSYWYRYDHATQNQNNTTTIYASEGSKVKFPNAANGIQVECRNTSGVRTVDTIYGSSSIYSDTTKWHHACGTIDGGSSANTNFFIDDTNVTGYRFGSFNGSAFDLTRSNHTIGAKANGTTPIVMSLYEFWFGLGIFLNVNTTSNRRKFINADLTPVGLGSDGSTPTGTAPKIYLSGAPSDFITNKGSGGNFSVIAGALIDVGPPVKANEA